MTELTPDSFRLRKKSLTGILRTLDTLESDAEIKIMIGRASGDVRTIISFGPI